MNDLFQNDRDPLSENQEPERTVATKIVWRIPATRAGIKAFADGFVSDVLAGNIDILQARARLDAMEKFIKDVKSDKEFRDAVVDEADNWGEKTIELDGVKFTRTEAVRYDYSSDPVWRELNDRVEQVTAERKDREELLKSLREPTTIEGVQVVPPLKRATSSVRVTIK